MRMHSLRLALAAATLATTSLVAHATPLAAPGQDAPAQGRQGRGGDMMKDLNLTADQKTKVEALMKEQRANGGMRGGQSGPPSDADRQAMQARRAEMDTKLKEILTPEQYTKYQSMRPQRGPRPGGNAPAN